MSEEKIQSSEDLGIWEEEGTDCEACKLEKRNPKSNFKPIGHTCGKCEACEDKRPMTKGEKEIAKYLDTHFDDEVAKLCWEDELRNKFAWRKGNNFPHRISDPVLLDAIKDFISQTIISERKQAVEEVRDIIIDWEKELGGLKHINGDWINLTYLLGKIKKYAE